MDEAVTLLCDRVFQEARRLVAGEQPLEVTSYNCEAYQAQLRRLGYHFRVIQRKRREAQFCIVVERLTARRVL